MSVTAGTNTTTKKKFSCFACLGKKRPPSTVYNFSPAGGPENGNNDVINDNGNFDEDEGIEEEVKRKQRQKVSSMIFLQPVP